MENKNETFFRGGGEREESWLLHFNFVGDVQHVRI